MIAASYWSLLAPAIQMAEESGSYGADGEYAFAPVAVGFLTGAFFVYITDVLISKMGINTTNMVFGKICLNNFTSFVHVLEPQFSFKKGKDKN